MKIILPIALIAFGFWYLTNTQATSFLVNALLIGAAAGALSYVLPLVRWVLIAMMPFGIVATWHFLGRVVETYRDEQEERERDKERAKKG